MTTRIENFKKLYKHPYLKKMVSKLNEKEIQFCTDFLLENQNLTRDEFAFKVNRIGLNHELDSFKNKTLIWDCLINSI